MSQERELNNGKREEEDQPQEEGEQGQAPQMILGRYHHLQLPLCDKNHQGSRKKRCYTKQLASLEQRMVKCERIGGRQELASKQPSSRLRRGKEAGDAAQVHDGCVVRLIRKKERHNKVCTSKGLRDQRVRLSANTAIQFYDIQDRLGYDQPSKAIDWLIEKAKSAIEALAELPAQNHNSLEASDCVTQPEPAMRDRSLYQLQHHQGRNSWPQEISIGSSSKYDMENQQHLNETTMSKEGIFSMVSQFQDQPTEQNSTQGLCLSHQSSESQDLYLHHSSLIDFDDEQALNSTSGLTDMNSIDTGRFQSLMALNSSAGNDGEEFFFNSLPSLLQQPLLRENQFFSLRGPLQSSNLFSLHASTNPPIFVHESANTESPNSLLLSGKGFSSGEFVGI
ncbi:hypothetical protein TIFTF001_012805 [Ficus carica]|uniref:TCP domain-containing protein n=1 Tax=Ficus carica TaxID=3494 RepID=A0AA88D292_FICCA|nr:hypothetical protein TIFTF001_012805 [Ficus carica]